MGYEFTIRSKYGDSDFVPFNLGRFDDPNHDIDKWRFAKFQVGQLFGWYFTDQNVNLAKMRHWLIDLVNLVEICSKPYLSNESDQ